MYVVFIDRFHCTTSTKCVPWVVFIDRFQYSTTTTYVGGVAWVVAIDRSNCISATVEHSYNKLLYDKFLDITKQ